MLVNTRHEGFQQTLNFVQRIQQQIGPETGIERFWHTDQGLGRQLCLHFHCLHQLKLHFSQTSNF